MVRECRLWSQELADVARDQMGELCYAAPVLTTGPAVELADKLQTLMGFEKGHTYFTSSGSEANETAFKIAEAVPSSDGESTKI